MLQQIRIVAVLGVLTALFLNGCTSTDINPILDKENTIKIEGLIRYIDNRDVEFVNGRYGLEAKVVGDVAKKVLKRGMEANDQLYQALRNKEQFVVAHVLLTMINLGEKFPITKATSSRPATWNRLAVEFDADNKATISPNQIPKLIEYWKRTLYPELVVPVGPATRQ